MAHFAKIEDGKVTNVIVIANHDCGGGEFPASESHGASFITSLGLDGEWKQTSYNGSFRGNFAGVGYSFDGDNFIPPQPYPSWTLDGANWKAPTQIPDDDKRYMWDEETLSWVEIEEI